ncbi:MAG: ankyrin repeat domain-containing protein [Bacteroidales bacterium]|nr:ankyrin repeat domain-containing protein [Bacteroidales bacterium]
MKRDSGKNLSKSTILLYILLLSGLLFSQCSSDKPDDASILSAIEEGDNALLDNYLQAGIDLNRVYGEEEITPLSYAVMRDKLTAAYLLLEHEADPEILSQGKTSLMFASRYNRPEIAKLLLSQGADINNTNEDKNTAFHYAAKYSNTEMLKLLDENGAEENMVNADGWTALDYAVMNGKDEIAEYLKSVGTEIFPKKISDSFDGPHIDILAPDKFYIKYMSHDSIGNETYFEGKEITLTGGKGLLQGLAPDTLTYYIDDEIKDEPFRYPEVARIIAIGDIHGQYERMVRMLISAGVIDDNLRWIWGNGHLVFTGDIFDRGAGVTEALWLIYRLEKQALNSGGKVHFLLGNHELMIMKDDLRYIAGKYYGLTSNLDIDYSELYSRETVLGRWIRSKNCIEIIGSTLFVHAGISPRLDSLDLDLEDINNQFRNYMNNPDDTTDHKIRSLLTGNYGPVWYRGFIKGSGDYEKMSLTALEDVLTKYNATTAVVGHTEVDSIGLINEGMVIHINIPLADTEIVEQALLIEGNNYYRISSDNKKTRLK